MRNKTISISDELFILLKQEDNASELITRVMWDYYNSLKEKEEKKPESLDPFALMKKADTIEQDRKLTEELNNMNLPDNEEAWRINKMLEQMP